MPIYEKKKKRKKKQMNFNKAVPFYLVSIDVYQISIMNTMQFVVFFYTLSLALQIITS